jgi:YidC/Oxa1 family membrane protein insertase
VAPDQRNLVAAIALSLAILLAFDYWIGGPQRERTRQDALQRQQTQVTQPAAPSLSTAPAPAAGTGAAAPGVPGAPAAPAAAGKPSGRDDVVAQAKRVPVVTPRLKGSISLTGGRLDDLQLAQYRTEVKAGSPNIVLLSPAGAPEPYYAELGWIAVPGSGTKLPGGDTVWQAEGTELRPGQPLTLTWDNGEGLRFRRTFAVDDQYLFTITQAVENRGEQPVTLHPYALVSRHGKPKTLGFFILHEGPLGVFRERGDAGGTLKELTYDDVAKAGTQEHKSVGGWIGITDKYWLTAIIPPDDASVTAAFRHAGGQVDRYQVDVLGGPSAVPARGNASFAIRLFAGAKEVRTLDRYETSEKVLRFDLAIDWGWFYFLTRPIFTAIDYFNHLLGNFGLAILLLTVIIKMAFLPLAYKSYVSMSGMKRIQPQMLELREKYGQDREKLSQEMMALYRREKINPASGCVPILLQIPVFFALYKVLFVTIEMRHAPFYGWIKDLSDIDHTTWLNLFGLLPWARPDLGTFDWLNLGVWPILMGITMWLQMRLNPQPPDPIQARLFNLMPFFFTFLLASFPAGLVIYWTWNNVLSMAQQWFIMQRTNAPKPAKS